ncbi:MAG: hypothetical protein ACKVIB_01645 [Pseudomonadales bacterium]
MAALIEDASAGWADRGAESYLLERLSESESLVYTHNDLPFSVKDRYVLAQVKRTEDSATFEGVMNSGATRTGDEFVVDRCPIRDNKVLCK